MLIYSRRLLPAVLATALLWTAACGSDPGPDSAQTAPADGSPMAGTTAAASTPAIGASTAVTPTLESVAQATQLAEERFPSFLGTLGESGEAPGQLRLPFGVAALDDGSLWVSDSKGVQQLDADGNLILQIDPQTVPLARGIDTGPDGTLYVAGYGAQVLRFASDGTALEPLGETGKEPGQLFDPKDLEVTSDAIYVVDAGNRRVEKFDLDGNPILTIGGPGDGRGEFTVPWSVTVGDDGVVYVSSADDYLIQAFSPEGEYLHAFGRSHATDNLWQTAGLSIGPAGRLFALQVPYNRLQAFDLTTQEPEFLWEFGGLGTGPRQFANPQNTDVAGNTLYVADTENDQIKLYRLEE